MQTKTHISFKIKLALAIATVLWASAFVGIRASLESYTPGPLALFRFIIASICMLVIYLRLPQRSKMPLKDIIGLLVIGGITLGVYHVALNYGEISVSSGTASFIISQSPIITAAFAFVVLRERLTIFGVIGMLISFLGVTLIMVGQGGSLSLDKGSMYVALAAIAGSIYSVSQKSYLQKYHAIEVTTFLMWGGTLALLIYTPDLSHELFSASLKATLSTVYLGIFPAALAYLAWSYALAAMPAALAVNFLYFMPIVATLLGWLCLGEIPVLMALIGGVVALLGVWVVNESYRWKAAK